MTYKELSTALSQINVETPEDEMYAFVSDTGKLLQVCDGDDDFVGYSKPYAKIQLPWKGTPEDLESICVSADNGE